MSIGTVPAIAGNTRLLEELRQMKEKQHLPHALLLHGPKGCGKKLIAKWYTMLALCEAQQHAPCGRCRSCRLLLEDAHPDVTYAEHSGKRGGFSVETARGIRKEAGILPSSGALRVFLFTDADGMTVQAQNALLKSVEEPLPHACFVFTAETAGALLPTLRSRMTAEAVFPVTEEESQSALLRLGISPSDARQAVGRFGGNIGKCIAYLQDPAMQQAAEYAASLTAALAAHNEYAMLKLLTAASADREQFRRTLEMFDLQLRDAAVYTLRSGPDRLGCDADAAGQLASAMTPARAEKLHGAVLEAIADLEGNVGAGLAAAALCTALAEA